MSPYAFESTHGIALELAEAMYQAHALAAVMVAATDADAVPTQEELQQCLTLQTRILQRAVDLAEDLARRAQRAEAASPISLAHAAGERT